MIALKSAILNSKLDELKLLLEKKEYGELADNEIRELITLSKNKGIFKIQAILLLKYESELELYSEREIGKVVIGLIEELSEDIYCSGWNDGIDNQIWDWGNGIWKENELFERRVVTSDCKIATDFGKKVNVWAEWSESQAEPKVIKLNQWIEKK